MTKATAHVATGDDLVKITRGQYQILRQLKQMTYNINSHANSEDHSDQSKLLLIQEEIENIIDRLDQTEEV